MASQKKGKQTSKQKNSGSGSAKTRTAGRKTAAERRAEERRLEEKRKKQNALIRGILLVLLTGFFVLDFVSLFVPSLSALKSGSYFLFGLFMYVMPFLLGFMCWYLELNGFSLKFLKKLLAVILFTFAVSGIFSGAIKEPDGGLLGRLNYSFIYRFTGLAGCFIINIVLILISLILFFDFSPQEYVKEVKKERQYRQEEDEKAKQNEDLAEVKAGKFLDRSREDELQRKEEIRRRERIQRENERKYRQNEKIRLENEARERALRERVNSDRFAKRVGIGDTTIRDTDPPVNTVFYETEDPLKQNMRAFREKVDAAPSESPVSTSSTAKTESSFAQKPASSPAVKKQESKVSEPVSSVRSAINETAAEQFRRAEFEPKIKIANSFFEEEAEQEEEPLSTVSDWVDDRNTFTAKDQIPAKSSFFDSDRVMNSTADEYPASSSAKELTFNKPSGLIEEQVLPPDPVDTGSMSGRNSGTSDDPFHKTVVTANGKSITVETDGDILSKKKVIHAGAQNAETEEEPTSAEEISSEIEEIQEPAKKYVFPPIDLLKRGKGTGASRAEVTSELRETADKLQRTLETFGVHVQVTNVSCGPSVTRYEIQPEPGVKVSKIVSLTDDIKLNLAAADIRMEAPIPGKSAIGIEVPNKTKQGVMLRDLIEAEDFKNAKSSLSFAAGKDIEGNAIIANIEKMPHVLVAGATGSGKSVCINTMIMSIIYHAEPSEVKMILIDPKVVEFQVYNGIPHLLLPVVTDPKKAAGALGWAVVEMEKRYQKFADYKVRGIEGFNEMVEREKPEYLGEPEKKMPKILIVVDELADLMMVAPGDVETAICRLAQKARAAGIHLVLATQRPSVDVITGLIKANIPSRIALSVSSGTDSRTIIDMVGAEKLLGNGDMLYYPAGFTKPLRVQGAYVSDGEINRVVDFLKGQGRVEGGDVSHDIDLSGGPQSSGGSGVGSSGPERDEYFAEAARLIVDKEKCSIGMLQRAFKIGFNRAARVVDQLYEAGVVGEEEGTKPRKVLMTKMELEEYMSKE